jgi:hypothetical protein
MKNLLSICFLMLSVSLFSNLFAQGNNEKYSYCQLVGTSNLLGTKVTVIIDYGQEMKWFKDHRLKDETGKPVKFNSMIDALNYMASSGWEHVQAYAITIGNSNVYHHLLKRRIEETPEPAPIQPIETIEDTEQE